jgi:uncharacterized protein YodC (DUF2158 family)
LLWSLRDDDTNLNLRFCLPFYQVRDLPMTILKSGDLVVLKSGGPVMTVDTVNTDIFDDNKVTGIFCAWFVGHRLERARFDQAALAPASLQGDTLENRESGSREVSEEYEAALDEMVAAMNDAADAPKMSGTVTESAVLEKPKRGSFAKVEKDLAGPPIGT